MTIHSTFLSIAQKFTPHVYNLIYCPNKLEDGPKSAENGVTASNFYFDLHRFFTLLELIPIMY